MKSTGKPIGSSGLGPDSETSIKNYPSSVNDSNRKEEFWPFDPVDDPEDSNRKRTPELGDNSGPSVVKNFPSEAGDVCEENKRQSLTLSDQPKL